MATTESQKESICFQLDNAQRKNREFFERLMKELIEKDMLMESDIARIRETCAITSVAID